MISLRESLSYQLHNFSYYVVSKLDLKVMSRYFRCLRDVISIYLREEKKSLGEDYTRPSTSKGETLRLRFFDQSLKK